MEFPHSHNHHHHHQRNEDDEQPPHPPPPFDRPPPPSPYYQDNEFAPPPLRPPPPPYFQDNEFSPPPPRPYYQEPEYAPPAPPSTHVSHVHHSHTSDQQEFNSFNYQQPPPPTQVSHVAHEESETSHHSFKPHLPSFLNPHSNSASGSLSHLANKPTVKVYCKARPNFSLTIRDGKVILATSDPSDEFQHWYKDEKYSTRVKDEEGFPCFALVNKATGQAMKQSVGASHPVQLVPYNADELDSSILWSESNDLGDGYRAVRMINNIRLNVDAFHGDKKSGGVHDGTTIVLWQWNKGDNQRWKITPYFTSICYNNVNNSFNYQQPPQQPTLVSPVAHEESETSHNSSKLHLPSFLHPHSSSPSASPSLSHLSNIPTVKVYCKAQQNFCLTIRDGEVILATSDPSDEFQLWYKDERYTKVIDEEGFPSFSLVNKATGQAMKHSVGNKLPVRLVPYNADEVDSSILWSRGSNLGDGYRAVKMVNNIRLTLDAFHAESKSGGVHETTQIVLWQCNKGKNQQWKLTPY